MLILHMPLILQCVACLLTSCTRPFGRYYGGGTLQAAAADSLFVRPRLQHPHEWLEDGTPNFYAIAGTDADATRFLLHSLATSGLLPTSTLFVALSAETRVPPLLSAGRHAGHRAADLRSHQTARHRHDAAAAQKQGGQRGPGAMHDIWQTF